MKELTVLVVEPNKEPYGKTIPAGLESLQKEVGGLIQAVYPWEEEVALICNDEGKLLGLPFNRFLRDWRGQVYDVIAGTFLIVGLSDDDFTSLSWLDRDWLTRYFSAPESYAIGVYPYGTPEKSPTEVDSAILACASNDTDPNGRAQ